MAIEMDAPESDSQEGDQLREPGKYHCAVLHVDEQPTNKDGKLIDNAVFRADCVVLDGTTAGQGKKEFNFCFFGPKMTDKDHGEMARKKIMFFCKSIGCLEVVDGKMKIDFAQAGGRQFVAEIEMRESTGTSGQKYKNTSLVYCNVYHVDDPRVKDVPKDAAALALLPKELRKSAADFQKSGQVANGAQGRVAGAAATGTKQAASQSPVNLDDL